MKYVTIQMLVKHTGKHRNTIERALRLAGVAMEKTPGIRGIRVKLADANKFLLRQWPEVGPMNLETKELAV